MLITIKVIFEQTVFCIDWMWSHWCVKTTHNILLKCQGNFISVIYVTTMDIFPRGVIQNDVQFFSWHRIFGKIQAFLRFIDAFCVRFNCLVFVNSFLVLYTSRKQTKIWNIIHTFAACWHCCQCRTLRVICPWKLFAICIVEVISQQNLCKPPISWKLQLKQLKWH